MFLVGLELNPDALRGQLRATVAISHASIVVPFVARMRRWRCICTRGSRASDVPFTSFALFIGVAMSITAFPVLARILSDRGMTRTPLGVVALTCAAVDDVTAWCLLALVVGVVQAHAGSALATIVLTLAFIASMFVVVRPIVARLVRAAGERRAVAGRHRAGHRGDARQRARHRGDRRPRDLRRLPARRRHPARQPARSRDASAASRTW